MSIKELSLFSGAGGGILGTHFLLGFQIVGAVDNNNYACKVLRQRQIDGILPDFPIWNMDIREFNGRVAGSYAGVVDVITAGFPCQPFSVAGKRKGAEDERNMWPETIRTICIVKPRYVLLENVPGLLAHSYIRRIFRDLATSGYDARWKVLSAAEVGAPHKRDRLWIVAYTHKRGLEGNGREPATKPDSDEQKNGILEPYGDVANPIKARSQIRQRGKL